MKIAIAGAGPAGLYFAYLTKKANPDYEILVLEQNPRGTTYGFGVVFSDTALTHLEDADDMFYAALSDKSEHWTDLTIIHENIAVPIDGNGFSAISRLELFRILEDLCATTGLETRYGNRLESLAELGSFDLIVGADGVNSSIRNLLTDGFKPKAHELTNRFIWYGTGQPFDTLSLTFRRHKTGNYVAHHYRYAPDKSTFIVECDETTFANVGFEQMDDAASRQLCEEIFAPDLNGHPLVSNNSSWRRFPVIGNQNWSTGNVVLIGDALRSIHFSIGSGTRLAMEDAVALFQSMQRHPANIPAALSAFVEVRKPQVGKLLAGARGSYEWYEQFASKMHLSPLDLAHDYMTRSGRMSNERLAKIAPDFTKRWQDAQS